MGFGERAPPAPDGPEEEAQRQGRPRTRCSPRVRTQRRATGSPTRAGTAGLETYECGEETIGDAWIQFDIRYYTVALVYVIFAVEIAFLFPWALVLRRPSRATGAAAGKGIGHFALVEGVLFVGILFLGLVYVWAKGDLDWVLYTGERGSPRSGGRGRR